MMYSVKFHLTISGKDPAQWIEFVKAQSIPFVPKEGDAFWVGSSDSGADIEVSTVSYDLTTELFEVGVDALYDWNRCGLDEITEASAVLQQEGWTIERQYPAPTTTPQTL